MLVLLTALVFSPTPTPQAEGFRPFCTSNFQKICQQLLSTFRGLSSNVQYKDSVCNGNVWSVLLCHPTVTSVTTHIFRIHMSMCEFAVRLKCQNRLSWHYNVGVIQRFALVSKFHVNPSIGRTLFRRAYTDEHTSLIFICYFSGSKGNNRNNCVTKC